MMHLLVDSGSLRFDAPIFHNQEGGWIGFNKLCPVLALLKLFW